MLVTSTLHQLARGTLRHIPERSALSYASSAYVAARSVGSSCQLERGFDRAEVGVAVVLECVRPPDADATGGLAPRRQARARPRARAVRRRRRSSYRDDRSVGRAHEPDPRPCAQRVELVADRPATRRRRPRVARPRRSGARAAARARRGRPRCARASRAKPACRRARRAFVRPSYATSRVSACLNTYSTSPSSDDAGRRRMKSRLSRSRQIRVDSSRASSYTGPVQNVRPITAAACKAALSASPEQVDARGEHRLHGVGDREVGRQLGAVPVAVRGAARRPRRSGSRAPPRRRTDCPPRARTTSSRTCVAAAPPRAATRRAMRTASGGSGSSSSVSPSMLRPHAAREKSGRAVARKSSGAANVAHDPLEQIEQRRLGPVEVLDEQRPAGSLGRQLVEEARPTRRGAGHARRVDGGRRRRRGPASSPRISRSPRRRRTSSGESLSRMPRCSFEHLAERPVGDAVAVGEAAAGAAQRLGLPRLASHSQSSRISVVLPTPASPSTVTSTGRTALDRAPYARLQPLELLARARRTADASPPTPRGRISESARTSGRHATPSGFALRLDRTSRSPNSNAPRTAATVRSPTRISPGSAACSSRAATLTASPLTNELPSRGRPATTSPVLTPMRSDSARRRPPRAAAASRARRGERARRGPRAPPVRRTPP